MFNKFFNILLLFVLGSCTILKPNTYLLKSDLSEATKYNEKITSTFLEKHLSVLASDEFEGRETTTKGQKKAAKYLSDFLKEKKIKSAIDTSYYQQFLVDVTGVLPEWPSSSTWPCRSNASCRGRGNDVVML